ncbi:MAG: ABC transporter ATP-binding protein [Treponema sp.]|jgi:ABC-type multidrug transport system ATPase subunit|nr:ABC transporter ATP-binding protein [Treponema sp.]
MILTGIKKRLGDFSLCVDKLSISTPGIYGLIGPNGSGKSTLAKIMTGLLNQDEGKIDTEGLNDKEITFLGRRPYMMDDTVYNNLVYPLQLRGIAPNPQMVDDFLDRMNFSKRAKQKAKSLSGGEQQKLAFLRAIIFKPRLIIADEAMTAMDMDSLDHFENTIREEQEKEKSIWIIISHQMPHIRRICDFVFFMYDGKMETEGSVQEIFSNVNNQYLRKYLRSYDG